MIIKLIAALEMTSTSSFSYTQRQHDEEDFSGCVSYQVAEMTGDHQNEKENYGCR
ncbi:MAG: hypothetical protein ACRD8W_12915 [Nitrososphaeraceae archaeon]|jgi:hypothetical protein